MSVVTPPPVSSGLLNSNRASPPRLLTDVEIDDIIKIVPRVMAACTQVAIAVHTEICNKLRLQLKEIVICVEGISQLKEDIKKMFDDSRVQPGTTVGIATSEASGLPIMQMTLNSFHQTGSAVNVSRGIESIRELFNMTKKRKHESTTIHFRRKDLTFEDVIDLRRQIVGVSIASLLSKKSYAENVVPVDKREWWYKTYSSIMDKPEVITSYYLRLQFDPNMLFAYHITLDEIVRILEAENVVKCVTSPTYIGIIDIYPNQHIVGKIVSDKLEGQYSGITLDKAPLFYLQHLTVPTLDKILVRGIPNLQQIFPVSIQTWTLVKNEQPYFSPTELKSQIEKLRATQMPEFQIQREHQKAFNKWRIWIDRIKFRTTGIPISKFIELLTQAKIEILTPEVPSDPHQRTQMLDQLDSNPPPVFVVSLPNLNPPHDTQGSRVSPGALVRQKLDEDESSMIANEERLKTQNSLYPIRNASPLYRAGHYVYAEANGTSLRHVLSHPLVDSRTTISNNYHEILATLGIEATRNFLLRDYHDIFTYNGAYVNYRFITLIVDFQTSLGTLLSVTSKGVGRQNPSVLTLATFDQPLNAFVNAAAFGKMEQVKNVSTAIFLGKRALIGTGSFDLELDSKSIEEEEARDQVRQQELSNPDNLRNVIEGIGDLHFETDNLQFDPDSREFDAMFNSNNPKGSPEISINDPRYMDNQNPPPHDLGPAATSVSNPGIISERRGMSLGNQIHLESQTSQYPDRDAVRPSIGAGITLCPKGPIPEITTSIIGLPSTILDVIGQNTVRSPSRSLLYQESLRFTTLTPTDPRVEVDSQVRHGAPSLVTDTRRTNVSQGPQPREPSLREAKPAQVVSQSSQDLNRSPAYPPRNNQQSNLINVNLPRLDFDQLNQRESRTFQNRPRTQSTHTGHPDRKTLIDIDDFLNDD
jgi:hypothetical protein